MKNKILVCMLMLITMILVIGGTAYAAPTLRQGSSTDTSIFGYTGASKSDISNICVYDSNANSEPTTYYAKWNASNAASTGEVTAYLVVDTYNTSMYNLYLYGDGGIKAPVDSSYLFYGYENAEYIEIGYYGSARLDASEVKNVAYMFGGLSNLESLYISGIDFSSVTDITNMFAGIGAEYEYGAYIDMQSANFSSLQSAERMFADLNVDEVYMNEVDFSSLKSTRSMFENSKIRNANTWNIITPNLENTSRMYYGCSSLTDSFMIYYDMSKVKDASYMFYGCTNGDWGYQNFYSKDFSSITNASYMFANSGIENISFDNADFSSLTNADYMFANCPKLNTINMRNIKLGSLETVESMFANSSTNAWSLYAYFSEADLKSLKSLDGMLKGLPACSINLTGADISSVTNLSNLFTGNTKLEYMYAENVNFSSVQSADSMFKDCAELYMADFSGTNFSSLKDTDYMFANCSGLSSSQSYLGLDFATTCTLETMQNMFAGCSTLRTLNLGSFATSSTINGSTAMQQMFAGDTNLEYILLNENFNSLAGSGMFSNCPNLKGIVLLKDITSSAQAPAITSAISINDTAILYVPNETSEAYYEAAPNYNTVLGEARVKPVLGFVGESTVTIPLKSIYVDEGITINGMTEKNALAFLGSEYKVDCSSRALNATTLGQKTITYTLKRNDTSIASITRNINVVEGDVRSVLGASIMSDAIISKTGVSKAKIRKISFVDATTTTMPENVIAYWDASAVEYPHSVLAWLVKNPSESKYYDLYIAGNTTVIASTGDSLFNGYTDCKEINLSLLDTSEVTNMQKMFTSCSSLESIDLSAIDTSSVTVSMAEMFKGCSKLKELDLTSFDTSEVQYMQNMFESCTGLTNLELTNFDTAKVTDMSYMFKNCTSLINLDISSFNTGNVTNMTEMFYSCWYLQDLDLRNFDTRKINSNMMDSFIEDCSYLRLVLIGENFEIRSYLGSAVPSIVTNKSITASAQAPAVGSEAYIYSNLYVPDETSKGFYEKASNYTTSFVNGELAIKTILELVGSDEVTVALNSKYVDAGATIAGLSTNDAELYRKYGYELTVTGALVDTSTVGTKEVKYTLKQDGNIIMEKTRTIKVTTLVFNGTSVTLPVGDSSKISFDYFGKGTLSVLSSNEAIATATIGDEFVTINGVSVGDTTIGVYEIIDGISTVAEIISVKVLAVSGEMHYLDNNGNFYETLASAFEGATSGSVITLLSDTTETEYAYLEGKGLMLDLNGNKITATISDMPFIYSYGGNLTINDSTGFGGIDMTSTTTQYASCMLYNYQGTIAINGGTYIHTELGTPSSQSQTCVLYTAGTASINDATLISNYTSGVLATGGLTITGESKISGRDYAVLDNGNLSLYIGEDDGNIIADYPSMEGGRYGVSADMIYFSDGVLKGATSPYYTSMGFIIPNNSLTFTETENGTYAMRLVNVRVDDIGTRIYNGSAHTPSLNVYHGDTLLTENTDYRVSYTNNVQVGQAIANISGTGKYSGSFQKTFEIKLANYQDSTGNQYITLAEAFANAASGSTITLLTDNYTDTSIAEVSAGKELTLDMDGKTLIKSSTGAYEVFVNKGTLNIIGGGTITATNQTNAIENSGTLYVEGTTINSPDTSTDNFAIKTSIGTVTLKDATLNGKECALHNTNNGTVIVENSNITATNGSAIYTDSTLTINGGTITGSNGVYTNGGTTTITAGTINAAGQGIQSGGGKVILGTKDGNVTNVPVITGEHYGILSTGDVEIYDGVIKGDKNNGALNVAGTVTVEDGHRISETVEGNYHVATLVEIKDPILMAETYENAYTNKYLLGATRYTGDFALTDVKREKIKTITILNTTLDAVPTSYVASWDVSNANDGSVTAWLVQDTTDTTMYHLYIGGEGGVIATSGKYLFYNFSQCISIGGLDELNTSSVTDMRYMFYSCSNLTSLDVSKFDTGAVKDMYYMFYSCSSLTSLDVSNFDTRAVQDMRYMFAKCEGLTSLDVSDFDTSAATKMTSMFYKCSSLTSLDVSNFDTDAVTTMSNMFSGCSSLTSLDVSNFETNEVTSMLGMFSGCSGLTSLDVSNFNTVKVTRMDDMFNGCSGLTNLDINNFDTNAVTNMANMFSGCSGLTSLNLNNFNTSAVTSNFNMFFDCSSLTSLLLGDNFDRINGISMFSITSKLTSIISTRTTPMTVTDTNGAVVNNGLKTSNTKAVIYVPNATVESAYEADTNYASLLGFTAGSDSPRIEPILGLYGDKDITVSKGGTYDESATVAGFKSVTGTDITPTEVKDYGYALTQTSNNVNAGTPGSYKVTYTLTLNGTQVDTVTRNVKVVSPILMAETAANASINKNLLGYDRYTGDFDLASVKREKIKTITILDTSKDEIPTNAVASWDISKAKDGSVMAWLVQDATDGTMYHLYIGGYGGVIASSGCYLFGNYTACTSINELTKLDTSAVTDMSSMFYNCSSLTSLDVSKFNTSAVTDMSSMFSACYSLKEVDFTGFDTRNVEDMSRMFLATTDIESIDLTPFNEGVSNTNKLKNIDSMFWRCAKLKTVIWDNFDTSNVTKMGSMFYECTSLEEMDLTHLNLSSVKDMSDMFSKSSALKTVNLSNITANNLNDVKSMFYKCSSLETVNFTGFAANNVTDMSSMFYNCTLLKTIDLKGFNTSNVTTMEDMLGNCKSLGTIDLRCFDTSSVTNMGGMFYGCRKAEVILLGDNFDRIIGSGMFSYIPNNGAIISTRTTPMIITDSTGTAVSTGVNVLYVPNETVEAAYEADENYATSFKFTMGEDSPRIEPILALVGEKDITIGVGATYEEAATVAGIKGVADENGDITPAEVKEYGYVLTQTSNNVNAGTPGSYKVTYTLTLNGTQVDTVTRNVKVVSPILMSDSQANAYKNKTLLGYDRYIGAFDLAGVKREKIKTITILDTSKDPIPTNAVASWDVSEYKNGSVTAWLVQDTNDTTMYHLYIGGYCGVIASAGHYLFANYTACTSINELAKLDTSAVTNMYYMFYKCSSLTSLDLSSFSTGAVKDMSWMFYECNSLTSLDVSGFSTGAVKNMSWMFYKCNSLTSLDVSGFSTGAVKDMSWMFSNCSGLTSLDLSSLNTSAVTNISYMFSGCSGLTSLDVSGFNTSAVTNMSSMFSGCSGLTSLDVSGFNTSAVTNMSGIFYGCKSLTNLDVSGFNTDLVTDMRSMFSGCSGLTSLDVSSLNTSAVTDMRYMFEDCTFTSIDLSKLDTTNVKYMGSMFSDCSNITNITLGNTNTSNLENISHMFSGCSKLEKIDLSSIDTRKVKSTDRIFQGCSKLQIVVLGKNFDKLNGNLPFTHTTKLKAVISLSTTPISIINENGTIAETGLENRDAVIYVPNETVEAAYEADSNYASLLGFTVGEDSPRVEPILALVGEKDITIGVGATYEEAATVAGYKGVADANGDITPAEVKEYGYVLTQTSNNVDSKTAGEYTVTYTLTLNGVEVDTVTRNVKVVANYSDGNGGYYMTLADAFAKAPSGSTVTLLTDNYTDTSIAELSAGKELTLDLDGKTLIKSSTEAYDVFINNGTLNIIGGGTISATNMSNVIENNGTLYVEGITINSPDTSYDNYAIRNANGTVTLKDSTLNGVECGVHNTSGTVIVENTNITATNGAAIYTNGTVTINGGTISGTTGVYTNGGTTTITAGTLNGAGQGIHSEGGKVILGTKDGSVTDALVITGEYHGILSNSDVEIYDGIIKGGKNTGALNVTGIVTVEDNYVISEKIEGDYQVITLRPRDTVAPTIDNVRVTYDENDAIVKITATDTNPGISSITVNGEELDITVEGSTVTGEFEITEKGDYNIIVTDIDGNAKVEIITAYLISYDGNEATSGTMPSQIKVEGAPRKVLVNTFARTLHTFVNWNISDNGIGKAYNEGDNYEEDSDVTLYAQWFCTEVPIEITSQPENLEIIEGDSGTFKVDATGTNIVYKWQVSTDGGNTWEDLFENTNTLVLGNVSQGMNGNKYRVVLTNYKGSVTSNEVTLTVKAALTCGSLELRYENASGETYPGNIWTNKEIYAKIIPGNDGTTTVESVSGSAQLVAETTEDVVISNSGTTTLKVKTTRGEEVLERNYIIKVDRTAPIGGVISYDGERVEYDKNIRLKVSGLTDAHSGISKYVWEYKDVNEASFTVGKEENSGDTVNTFVFEATPGKKYVVKVTVYDKVNNSAEIDGGEEYEMLVGDVKIKPTIRFTNTDTFVKNEVTGENELNAKIIIKSSSALKEITINKREVDVDALIPAISGGEFVYTIDYVISTNGVYSVTCTDSDGQKAVEEVAINIFTEPVVTYKIVGEGEDRKITFNSTIPVKIFETSPSEYADDVQTDSGEYSYINRIEIGEDEIEADFIFVDKHGNESNKVRVRVESASTEVKFIRAVEQRAGNKFTPFDTLDVGTAFRLAQEMENKIAVLKSKVVSYYGVSTGQNDMFMSRARDVGAAVYLMNAGTVGSYDGTTTNEMPGNPRAYVSTHGLQEIGNNDEYMAAYIGEANDSIVKDADAKYKDKILSVSTLRLYKGFAMADYPSASGNAEIGYLVRDGERTYDTVNGSASANKSFRITLINK